MKAPKPEEDGHDQAGGITEAALEVIDRTFGSKTKILYDFRCKLVSGVETAVEQRCVGKAFIDL